VTGLSDSEEEAVKSTEIVHFLLEDEIKKLDGHYSSSPDWGVYVKTDGLLITGQNPASSDTAATALLEEFKINR
jgi:putative intracellular protease/amidase